MIELTYALAIYNLSHIPTVHTVIILRSLLPYNVKLWQGKTLAN